MARAQGASGVDQREDSTAERFMRLALEQARLGVGRSSPNPPVGAVLVKNGQVIASGYHRRAGTAHGEVVALRRAGEKARGADLYCTLLPCNHFGRTPPCTDAIIAAGVKRVFYASEDPFPPVRGSAAKLRRAGIQVFPGVLKAEADRLHRPFFRYILDGRPWVTLKAAVTLDGKLATSTGDSRWISSEASRREVHLLRDQVDAVLVGANTALRDNPRLTARVPGGRDPVRVVVDSQLRLSPTLRLFKQRSTAPTVVATILPADHARARRMQRLGVEVWSVRSRLGRVDVRALLKLLARRGLIHVLVEGGSELFGALLRERLADELLLFVAPKLVGIEGLSWAGQLGVRRMAKARPLYDLQVRRVGPDVLIQGLFKGDRLLFRSVRSRRVRPPKK